MTALNPRVRATLAAHGCPPMLRLLEQDVHLEPHAAGLRTAHLGPRCQVTAVPLDQDPHGDVNCAWEPCPRCFTATEDWLDLTRECTAAAFALDGLSGAGPSPDGPSQASVWQLGQRLAGAIRWLRYGSEPVAPGPKVHGTDTWAWVCDQHASLTSEVGYLAERMRTDYHAVAGNGAAPGRWLFIHDARMELDRDYSGSGLRQIATMYPWVAGGGVALWCVLEVPADCAHGHFGQRTTISSRGSFDLGPADAGEPDRGLWDAFAAVYGDGRRGVRPRLTPSEALAAARAVLTPAFV